MDSPPTAVPETSNVKLTVATSVSEIVADWLFADSSATPTTICREKLPDPRRYSRTKCWKLDSSRACLQRERTDESATVAATSCRDKLWVSGGVGLLTKAVHFLTGDGLPPCKLRGTSSLWVSKCSASEPISVHAGSHIQRGTRGARRLRKVRCDHIFFEGLLTVAGDLERSSD